MALGRYSSGTAGLDTICEAASSVGPLISFKAPGAGKTILANQFCFHHAAGHRALYISLLAESHQRMLTYMHEMSFFDESVLPQRLSYISAFSILQREGLNGLLKLV